MRSSGFPAGTRASASSICLPSGCRGVERHRERGALAVVAVLPVERGRRRPSRASWSWSTSTASSALLHPARARGEREHARPRGAPGGAGRTSPHAATRIAGWNARGGPGTYGDAVAQDLLDRWPDPRCARRRRLQRARAGDRRRAHQGGASRRRRRRRRGEHRARRVRVRRVVTRVGDRPRPGAPAGRRRCCASGPRRSRSPRRATPASRSATPAGRSRPRPAPSSTSRAPRTSTSARSCRCPTRASTSCCASRSASAR